MISSFAARYEQQYYLRNTLVISSKSDKKQHTHLQIPKHLDLRLRYNHHQQH